MKTISIFDDTIAAIATPFGTGGISVIRVSGNDAIDLVNKVFKGKDLTKVKSHTIHYGHIVDKEENILDEVMVSVMKSPRTFTAENTVEISTHGGILVTQRVLEEILSNNVRLANPGEFSERAYLNGRIDLVEAESIMDVIYAKNEQALKIANLGVKKQTSKLIYDLRDKLLEIIANIEVNIDYPEYDQVDIITNEVIKPKTVSLIKEIEYLLNKSYQTRIIREGVKTAIIGKPNVGKSSLLNTLLDEERAIVTDIAGTTRDIVDAYVNLSGITLQLIDTAGIRETVDVVEKIGVERSKKAINEAELILLVIDQSEDLTAEDLELMELTKDKNRIIILNKSDLKPKVKLEDAVVISTIEKSGIDTLEQKILEKLKLDNLSEKDYNYLSNARHIQKVREAKESLESVIVAIENEMPIDILAIDLTNAWNLLGEIVGSNYDNELIDQLFSKFCLGK